MGQHGEGVGRAPIPIHGIGLLAGPANVIMQLSWPAVGYGVKDSPVTSGQLFRHPVKRARTTLTYLAVALLGDEGDRASYRRAVNRSHAQVRSGPDSPVAYHAFDRDLQLWVAACLYYGLEDVLRRLELDPPTEATYRASSVLGTTLQVRPEQWPAGREAFARYWEEGMAHISVDEPVRRYLDTMTTLRYLPFPVPQLLGRPGRWVTTGFLPPPFRQAMGYRWSAADERRFAAGLTAVGRIERRLPGPVTRFPFNVLLRDVRRRERRGRPLV